MEDKHRERIHQWLAGPDPSLNHVQAREKLEATTSSWFIRGDEFVKWKSTPNSTLWLSGIPGCGKTILASTIIEDVLEDCRPDLNVGTMPSRRAVVYFYFDFNDSEKRSQKNMIRTSIKQLSQQLPYTSAPLESLFSSCTNGNRQPTVSDLQNTLVKMIEEFDQVFLILDALDECNDLDKLMESIQKIAGSDLKMLHVLATSRMEGEIKDGFSKLTDEQTIRIESDVIDPDIRAYIYTRLQADSK